MRLKNSQVQSLIKAFEEVFKNHGLSLQQCALYLYGSRAKDELKGGDIDLLFRVPSLLLKDVNGLRIEFSLVMQKYLGEQKIDLLIINRKPPKDPFHHIAVDQSILLKEW